MANLQSDYAKGKLPTRIAAGSELVPLYYECSVPATGDGTAVNDTIEMGPLPAGHLPVDVIFMADDLDSGGAPAHAVSFGVLNSGKTDLSTATADGGAVWASGLTIGQGGTMARLSAAAAYNVTPAEADRPLGFKVTTASATKAAGKIRCIVLARAVP